MKPRSYAKHRQGLRLECRSTVHPITAMQLSATPPMSRIPLATNTTLHDPRRQKLAWHSKKGEHRTWKIPRPFIQLTKRLSTVFPAPASPTSSRCPMGWRSTRSMRSTCSSTPSNLRPSDSKACAETLVIHCRVIGQLRYTLVSRVTGKAGATQLHSPTRQ